MQDESAQAETAREDIYKYEEIEVVIPKEWQGKYIAIEAGDELLFYHTASREPEKGMEWGLLGRIIRTEHEPQEWFHYWPIAYTSEHIYYYVDFPGISSAETEEEYETLREYNAKVMEGITINDEDVHYDADEYYFPLSAYKEIPDIVLRHMPKRSYLIDGL